MPRQFSFRGDRLAYSWGIVLLAAVAFGLLWAFGGDTHALIPLYSVGVFVCFTLSQVGMVRHWLTERSSAAGTGGWPSTRVGAVLTAVVLVVVVSEKFVDGAYLVVILIPTLVGMMLFINHQYGASAARAGGPAGPRRRGAASRGTGRRPDPGTQPRRRPGDQRRPLDQRRRPRGLHLGRPERRGRGARAVRAAAARACRWSSSSRRTGRSPGRSSPTSTCSTRPGRRTSPTPITFVVIPEYVARSWWERILYNQAAKRLRTVLLGRPHTVVVNVPYRREDPRVVRRAPNDLTGAARTRRPDGEQ